MCAGRSQSTISFIQFAFPNGLPSTPDEVSQSAEERMDELRSTLDPFDQEFYQYPHNLTELLYEFVLKHPEEFGTPPFPES
ncbi:MAG: DMP19 family protein [Candidatus Obscuribacterales bacterium]|nr:DMP19 family protein [Candidatus Obscuribacterales bacterium]